MASPELPRARPPTRGSTDSDDPIDRDSIPPNSCISRIFHDAALFGDILQKNGCMKCYSKVSDGFASLVGPALNPYEQAIAARLAKLSVTNTWTPLTDEPESYRSDSPTDTISELTEQEKAATENTEDKTWELAPDEIIGLL